MFEFVDIVEVGCVICGYDWFEFFGCYVVEYVVYDVFWCVDDMLIGVVGEGVFE